MDFSYRVILGSITNVILCCEYASSLLGLSSFPDDYLTLYGKHDKNISMNYAYVYGVDKLDYSNTYCINEEKNLFITNEERTIVDMIKHECEGKMIFQALEAYEKKFGDYNKLLDYAITVNLESEVHEYIDNIGEYMNE